MICQICSEHPATVHVTEIPPPADGKAQGGPQATQRHLCEACASQLDLPHSPVVAKKHQADIWKLLQQSARRARQEANLSCPDCGMTLAEFRSKGRLGCPRDYEVFQKHLEPVLLRVHNATRHEGRVPLDAAGRTQPETSAGASTGEDRLQLLSTLREKLEAAIRNEAYESAAQLRDEIQELEAHLQGPA